MNPAGSTPKMTQNKPIKLLRIRDEKIEHLEQAVDIVPVQIDYNGEAEVDSYFRAKIKNDETNKGLKTNLYGRDFKGIAHQLDSDQKLYVMEYQNRIKQTNFKTIAVADRLNIWDLAEHTYTADHFQDIKQVLKANEILHSIDD